MTNVIMAYLGFLVAMIMGYYICDTETARIMALQTALFFYCGLSVHNPWGFSR